MSSSLPVSQELFSSFYNEKYQGRRLTWQHSTERCIVTARFPKGKKELELSLLQVSLLSSLL
jgi:cullin 4